MSRDRKDEEMIYGLTVDERDALVRGLDELPQTMPPRVLWHRIREQAEAEGLIGKPRSRQPQTWYLGGSLAAAVLLAVLVLPRVPAPVSETPMPATPTAGSMTGSTVPGVTSLQSLMVESAQLEQDLRALPERRVKRAGTQAAILEIEDKIAAIDYQLSDPESQLSDEEVEIFWRERVRLMRSLVRLRAVQAQRASF